MSEQKPEKKVVSRTVAIALGIIAIVLVVGLVGAMANYNSVINGKDNTITTNNAQIQTLTNQKSQLQTFLNGNESLLNQTEKWLAGNQSYYTSIINSKNSQIASQQTTITNDQNTINSQQTTITNEQNTITSLQNEVNSLNATVINLTNIINLSYSVTWVNDQTVSQGAGSYSTWGFSASYAGYVSIYISSSTVSGTWVTVIYSAYGVSYNQYYVISAGSTAYFPVLPCSSITVGVGNGNVIGSATETVYVYYTY